MGLFFDNREFGIKENYNVTRFSEFTGKGLLGSAARERGGGSEDPSRKRSFLLSVYGHTMDALAS